MSTISYRKVVHGLRSVFQSGKTLPVDFRVKQLQSFLEMVEKNEAVFCSALAEDLRKPSHESFICELDILRNEIVHTLNHLRDWVKPEKTSKTLPTILDKSFIKNDPYGIVLILGAWNYPIQLSLLPAVGAIAAGMCNSHL
ncbi:ALDH3A2 (predicted) [Pycnogonum litorale]